MLAVQFTSGTEQSLTVIPAEAGIHGFWGVGKNSRLKPLPPGVRETCGSCGRQSASRSAFAAQMKSFSLRPPTSWVEYRSEEHTSELQSLMRISYAVFCLKKKNNQRRA